MFLKTLDLANHHASTKIDCLVAELDSNKMK
jgi:hypothetical protein